MDSNVIFVDSNIVNAQAKTTPPSLKKVTEEYEVIRDDRCAIVDSAIRLVSGFISLDGQDGYKNQQKTLAEQSAYEAALYFLENQFHKGAVGIKLVPRRSEKEFV